MRIENVDQNEVGNGMRPDNSKKFKMHKFSNVSKSRSSDRKHMKNSMGNDLEGWYVQKDM